MRFKPAFQVGEVVSNKGIYTEFKCGNTGGMRRSHETNTLTIISNHTDTTYDDKWIDNVLYYTGMGKNGDQTLQGNQNGTLYESGSNGVEVHLFEVIRAGAYVYRGTAVLAEKPYQSQQRDVTGKQRHVWVFPLKISDGHSSLSLSAKDMKSLTQAKRADRMSLTPL